jgi:hypothetical protein
MSCSHESNNRFENEIGKRWVENRFVWFSYILYCAASILDGLVFRPVLIFRANKDSKKAQKTKISPKWTLPNI